jgi:diguanylate cyclase (GGDEF)-like protein/PAS domain S-box-containing protein
MGLLGRPPSGLVLGLYRAPEDELAPGDDRELQHRTERRRPLRLAQRPLEVATYERGLASVAAILPEGASGRSAAERAELTLDSLDDSILRTDSSGRLEYLNPTARSLLGWGLEALGRPLRSVLKLVDELTREPIADLVDCALADLRPAHTSARALLVLDDSREVAVHGSASPLLDGSGQVAGAVLILRDVADTRALELEMAYLARHDPLTGLINRREFERRLRDGLTSAAQEGRDHALLYLDLDQFKLVNDTCGHLAGDEMLKQVAALLRSRLRRSDWLARLGGDEFGFLLFDCSPSEAPRQLAEEFRRLVRTFRFAWGDQVFETSASIGLVPIHAGSGDLTDVLRAADSACYVVKDSGGNGVHSFSPDDTAIGVRQGEMLWVQRLQRALDERRLRLHYQMIEPLSPQAGRPMCELFLRLLERDGSLHNAAKFIGAAKRFGLMVDLDRWVIHNAFQAMSEALRNQHARGAEFRLGPPRATPVGSFAINLSAHSLASHSFLEFVLAELHSAGVLPESVCFEITETAAISNLDRAIRFISSLRKIGCRFSLDDFGRGLSSFTYLRDLKIDLLKIDGEFIRDLPTDSVSRAMVASIHQIAQAMGISTVAEGVESSETVDALREVGVDYAQGYFLHRPQALVHDY